MEQQQQQQQQKEQQQEVEGSELLLASRAIRSVLTVENVVGGVALEHAHLERSEHSVLVHKALPLTAKPQHVGHHLLMRLYRMPP